MKDFERECFFLSYESMYIYRTDENISYSVFFSRVVRNENFSMRSKKILIIEFCVNFILLNYFMVKIKKRAFNK